MSDDRSTKRCRRCKQRKPTSEFRRSKKSADGLWSYCRPCGAELTRRYFRTPRGRAFSAWRLMNRRVRVQPEYAGIEVRMTKEAFLEWAVPRFEAWIAERPDEVPTIDRIESAGHYEIGNIRLLEWGENCRQRRNAHNIHAPDGQAWCSACKQYLAVDNFCRNASTGSGLNAVCRDCATKAARHRRGGYRKWRNISAPDGQVWCTSCQGFRPKEAFYKSRQSKTGLQAACKQCQSSRAKAAHRASKQRR